MSTGDELEQLANRFNDMAGELAASKEKSERINRLKQFSGSPSGTARRGFGKSGIVHGQRREVVAIFGD